MSQKLNLDYVEQSSLSFKRFSIWTLLLFLAGLLLLLYVVKHYQSLQEDYTRITQSMRHNSAEVERRNATNKLAVQNFSEDELKNINETVTALSTPWDQLLASLEKVDMKDVALLLLEPNNNKQKIMLTGEAKNIESMLNYVESVSTLPMLSKVYLQNHMIELDAPNQPVSFTIAADWK